MNIGDLVTPDPGPQHKSPQHKIYISDEFPWNDTFGWLVDGVELPHGSMCTVIDQRQIHTTSLVQIWNFVKILTPIGIGWIRDIFLVPVR